MFMILMQLSVSIFFIVLAGSFLAKFAERISVVTGWGRIFVGGLLLAGATSLPELMVGLKAVELDLPDLAVGDVLGGCLFNLLLLSMLDFFYPSSFRRTAFSPANDRHSLVAVLAIILIAIVGLGISSELRISFAGVSIFIWAVVTIYILGMRLIYMEGRGSAVSERGRGDWKLKSRELFKAFLGYGVSALVILSAAPYLVHSADELAKITGLGHTFVGTTLVAVATSLPELVSTVAAFRMGMPDLAIGNIFGSNALNMVLFFPLDLVYAKSLFASVRSVHSVTAFAVIIAMGVAVMGQLYRKTKRTILLEPSSEVVVVVIVLSLTLLYFLSAI